MEKISQIQLRKFGLLIGTITPFLFAFLIPLIYNHSFRLWPFFIGIPFILLGIIKPKFLRFPYKCWMYIGDLLGWLNSKIILGLIFVLILQPTAFIMKLFNYDPLKMKRNNKKSYRESNEKHKIDLTKIF